MASCFFGLLLTSLVVGCTSSSPSTATSSDAETEEDHHHDHDHGHRPESYMAALTQIKHCRDEVKVAFDAGTPEKCDDALHVVAEVLGVLPEVAAETDMPKEDWQVVKDQSKVLFNEFMKIHDGFHGDAKKEGVSFDSVAATINASVELLESKVAATGEKAPTTSGDHDHDDHGEHDGHDH